MTRRTTTRTLLGLAALVVLGAPAESMAARSLSIDDATRAEPSGSGTAAMTLDVTLSKANAKKAVKAEFKTSPGSANSLDYRPTFGTVKVPAGETTAEVSVPVRGDLFAEPDETFSVKLSNAKRASIDDGEAEGLIPANDNGPDTDGDDIPDADDCAPNDPNPEDQLECFVPTTIYDLNAGELEPGTRAYIPNVLVTARSNSVAYGQIIPGDPGYAGQDFSAIELRPSGAFFDQGQRARLIGTVRADHFQVTDYDSDSSGFPIPDPIAVTPAALAAGPDALNGLLVEVTSVSVASSDDSSWLLTEGLRIDNDLFGNLPQYGPGDSFESIRGHASTLGAATPSLSPRSLDDIDPTVAKLLYFESFDTCLTPNEQDAVIGQVVIDEPQASDTLVTISGEGSVLSLPATVTVPAGQTSAQVIADVVTSEDTFTEVTATFGPLSDEIFVEVWSGC